jgi:hypothetical protein
MSAVISHASVHVGTYICAYVCTICILAIDISIDDNNPLLVCINVPTIVTQVDQVVRMCVC